MLDAVHLELVILLLDLLLLGLFLVLVVHVVDVSVADQVISLPLLGPRRNLALLVVVVDVDLVSFDVKLSLFDLVGCRKVWVQLELLRHLVDQHVLAVVVLWELDGGLEDLRVGREGH